MVLFYLLIFIMPLDQHPFWGRELIGTFTPVKAIGMVCFLLALYQVAFEEASIGWFNTGTARLFAIFTAFQCASFVIHAGHLAIPDIAYSHVFSIVSLFITTVILIKTPKAFCYSVLASIAAVGFASLYTIRQQQKYGDSGGFRPSGMLGDANEYALIAALWMPLAFLWIFSRRPKWERALCAGSLAALLLGTTFASSRGGFLGMAAAFLFLVIRSRKPLRNFAVITAAMIPLLVLSPSSPWRRFRNPNFADKLAEQARLITWKAGLRMIAAHPLAGIGMHNFRPMVEQYEGEEKVISLAHNTYIEIGAELGAPAVIPFVGIFLASLWSLEQSRSRARSVGMSHLGNVLLGLQAGIVSYLFSAFFVTAWWQKMVWLLVFMTVVAHHLTKKAVSRHRIRRQAQQKDNETPETGADLSLSYS